LGCHVDRRPSKTQFWFVPCPAPAGKKFQLSKNASCGTRRLKSSVRFRGIVQKSRQQLVAAGAIVQVVKSCKTITGSAKNPDVGA
jgi:hypothetical protein